MAVVSSPRETARDLLAQALGALARALLASGRPAEAEGALRRARKAGFIGDENLAAEIARALRG